jgi:GMP synthase (glutamine-hydrolysing)
MSPRLLVAEGNTVQGRNEYRLAGGTDMSESYARLLRELSPEIVVEVCYPADLGATLPDRGDLASYDGLAITGSSLNVYAGGPAIARQIEFVRAALAAGIPIFGSCWGLQVLTVAAGGTVRRNPNGREVGFGRRIHLTPVGANHPMYHSKGRLFDAVTTHLDEVATLAPGMTVLATNSHSAVQAAALSTRAGGVAWGVQYHPELSLADLAAIMRRYGVRLVEEGFFAEPEDLDTFVIELETLDRDPDNRALAWRHGLDGAVLDWRQRVTELDNWLTTPVRARHRRRLG